MKWLTEFLRPMVTWWPERNARPLLCSDCFIDTGLRIEASRKGRQARRPCQRCGSRKGLKLYRDDLNSLVVEFFWNGSFIKTDFGGANRLASNPYKYGSREVEFPSWLERDAHLLEDTLKVGIFHYGPQLWRLGYVEPLQALTRKRTRRRAIKNVLAAFPERSLAAGKLFYRLRKNLDESHEQDHRQYDSPPRPLSSYGRLDSESLPILYGSEDLEICVHECRTVIPDECFVATLFPTRDLRMLDLTAEPLQDGPTPFESIGTAMHFLFSAEDHSYEITRAIAEAAAEIGFDGVFFPSYFSLVKPERVANIAIFGHPIETGLVQVRSINRARLKSVDYEIRLGPLFS